MANADVTLPAIFGDNMVIQQGGPIPMWGTAQPGESVSIRCDWSEQGVTASADDGGRWSVSLPVPKGTGPYTMTIKGKNEIVIKNILCGEVWVCSGQSNMWMPLRRAENAETEVAAANFPQIRLFTVGQSVSETPKTTCKGVWNECSPEVAAKFSAIGYYFARSLHTKLQRPVGIINSTWGGAPGEAFVSAEVLRSDADLKWYVDRWQTWENEKPVAEKEYNAALAAYDKAARDANESGKAISMKKPQQPRSLYCLERPFRRPSGIFNAMVAPIIPYGIKGVIWYQGESNKDTADGYQHLFTSLIRDWRQRWKQGDYPFLFVQLAAFRSKEDPDGRARVQDAQRRTLDVPKTAMAVALDVGELDNLHPLRKKPLGERLALCALARAYGNSDVVFSGPLYRSMKVEDNKIRLSFDCRGSGLVFKAKDGASLNFTVAGADRKFHAAKTSIDGASVLVSSDAVKAPVAVRYCWTAGDEATLFNVEGLPAALFRTDDW